MKTITQPMTRDHRQCDDLFVQAESAVMHQAWDDAERHVAVLDKAMKRHFETEEKRLFPAMQAASAQAGDPIGIMSMEHEQMRYLIARLGVAVAEREKTDALGTCETLLVTMQQHNMKEEQVLYPMADRLVPALAERIAQDMMERA